MMDFYNVNTHNDQAGQSIVEAIVMVGIVMLMITGLVVGMTRSIKNARFSNTKGPAIKYAQEGLEVARNERDVSWSSFLQRKNATDGLWCLDDSMQWTDPDGDISVCEGNINNALSRSLTFTWNGSEMTVTSRVDWRDGNATRSSSLSTEFTNWRR